MKKCFLFLILSVAFSHTRAQVRTGAEMMGDYLPHLKGIKVGVVFNQTSRVGRMHLLDSLLKHKVKVKKIFVPEHGFRGDHSAGAQVKSGMDPKTRIPVVSLYGSNKKPSQKDLKDIDVVLFDLQDVGARFYTYISTLHYVMEACAESRKLLIVLDRPNPNGFYVDGPVLDTAFRSFVGMHPVPVVHGMTIGEYAQMINGEGWLANKVKCSIKVVKCWRYSHKVYYAPPVKPSPNLPGIEAIQLYPALCLFEGTNYSVGRGTDKPFECVGRPGCPIGTYTFTPHSIPGVAEDPPHKDKECRGFLLTDFARNFIGKSPQLNIFWLMDLYKNDPDKTAFFTPFFDKLAGSSLLRQQIIKGLTEDEIRKSWEPALSKFKDTRKKYLLYPD